MLAASVGQTIEPSIPSLCVRGLNPKHRAGYLLFGEHKPRPAAARSLQTANSKPGMQNDMALAAAYAAGAEPPAQAFAPQRSPHGGAPPSWTARGGDDAVQEGEMPSVDDLEVAAAAAGVAPVPALLAELGYFEMGAEAGGGSQAMEASSSDDSGSSSDDEGAWGWGWEAGQRPLAPWLRWQRPAHIQQPQARHADAAVGSPCCTRHHADTVLLLLPPLQQTSSRCRWCAWSCGRWARMRWRWPCCPPRAPPPPPPWN